MVKNKKINAVGIIAEYNPFHNGHAYHIKKARELTNSEYCIAVISGDFVQRGAPAIFDKYTRTAMALSCGADLVLEIPSLFATSSAEDFSSCAIALLNNLGVTDSVCFGSECGDIGKISAVASILATEPPLYTEGLKRELKNGLTFPEARYRSLISCNILTEEETSILTSPNNILGIEYCKAIIRSKSPIRPVTILRKGSGYHDSSVDLNGFSSATGIRSVLKDRNGSADVDISHLSQVPEAIRSLIVKGYPIFPDDFSSLLNAALLRLAKERISFSGFLDVSEELAARITRQLPDFLPFEEKAALLKTRQYTYTRISRALLHIVLGMTDEMAVSGRQLGYAPYARVLGFRKDSTALMSEIKKRGTIPLITKTAGLKDSFSGPALDMLRQDFYCSHIYQTIVQEKYHIKMKNEFTRSVVII